MAPSVLERNQSGNGKTVKKREARRISLRLVIQIFFFILIALIATNHNLEERGMGINFLSSASLHAVCPFGGVVSIYQYITAGTYIKKIHESAFILMYLVFALALFVGPAFCGWVCPLGSFQEWLGKLGKKISKRNFNNLIPYHIDKYLRYLRYVVLVWVVYVTATSAVLFFADYDPYFALFNFWTGDVATSGLIILAIVILLSLFIERPFCKYACPYGAVLGVFNLFRIFKIKRNIETCIDCKACDRVCPMSIKVSNGVVVRDHQCISCLECTSEFSCPVDATVELTTGKFSGVQ
ncbi:4Fe-4S binding protein [Chloroflexota bacterium]